MIEIESAGPWPKHAFTDINRARVQLDNEFDYETSVFTLVGPSKILKILDAVIPGTACTYAFALKDNDIVKEIIRDDESTEDYVILHCQATSYNFPEVKLTHIVVKILGIKQQEHVKPIDVSDERLLELLEMHAREAYTIFENSSSAVMLEATRRLLEKQMEADGSGS